MTGKPNNDLAAFEASLAAVVPREAVDREAIVFEAGRRAGARRSRPWQVLAATAACVAVAAALLYACAPRMQVVERVVYVHGSGTGRSGTDSDFVRRLGTDSNFVREIGVCPQSAPGLTMFGASWFGQAGAEDSYLHLRDRVLREGLSALPPSPARAAATKDPKELLKELLNG